jgi:hypothetical protein
LGVTQILLFVDTNGLAPIPPPAVINLTKRFEKMTKYQNYRGATVAAQPVLYPIVLFHGGDNGQMWMQHMAHFLIRNLPQLPYIRNLDLREGQILPIFSRPLPISEQVSVLNC